LLDCARHNGRSKMHLFESLKSHVKEKAGPWKFPRWIELRKDLPRTATGKIQRYKLRDEDLAAR
jgi:4-hydroxybenzoate-CoA ligase